MAPGEDTGTSEPLTVQSAASRIEEMLSGGPEDEQPKTRPEDPAPETPSRQPAAEDPSPEEEADEAEPKDPDEPESDPPADDEPTDEDDAEPDADDPPAPRTHKVKVDGEEIEVTDEELLKGYSRTADYTRKTQAHAEKVRQFEQEYVPRAVQTLTQYEASLTQVQKLLTDSMAEPNWDEIRANSTAEEFAAAYAEWSVHQKKLDQVRAEQQRVAEEKATLERQSLESYIQGERAKLAELIPEWSKPEIVEQDWTAMRQTAQSFGFTDDELSQVYDHRLMLLLRAAAKATASSSEPTPAPAKKPAPPTSAKKPAAPTTPTLEPGPKADPTPKAHKRRAEKMNRLRATGSVKDAAAFLVDLL